MSRVIARHDDVDVAAVERAERRAFWWREGMILGGFVVLLVAAVWTVALPELRKEPEGEGSGEGGNAESAPAATPASASAATPPVH